MGYWLIKSEPLLYSFEQLEYDGRTSWDGVRNYQARNNLQKMREGDIAVFYHSIDGRAAIGLVEIVREHYPDPTTDDRRWVCVDVSPIKRFDRQVSLTTMKSDPRLANIGLIRQTQLSVMPLTESEFEAIIELGESKLDKSSTI